MEDNALKRALVVGGFVAFIAAELALFIVNRVIATAQKGAGQ